MSQNAYDFIWITSDLVSLAVVIGIFCFQKWRMSGMQNYNPEQIMLSAVTRRTSRDVNIMKEKLIFSELNNGLSSTEELSLYPENGYARYSHGGLSRWIHHYFPWNHGDVETRWMLFYCQSKKESMRETDMLVNLPFK